MPFAHLYVGINFNLSFYFDSALRPFQDHFRSYKTSQSVGGRKRENHEKLELSENLTIAPLLSFFAG